MLGDYPFGFSLIHTSLTIGLFLENVLLMKILHKGIQCKIWSGLLKVLVKEKLSVTQVERNNPNSSL